MQEGHPRRPATGRPHRRLRPACLDTIALLTGRYRLSKRQVRAALANLLSLSISTGMVSKAERRAAVATAEPVAEVGLAVAGAPALSMDETGWRQANRRV